MPGTLFCAGFGYSARALAARLIPQGWRVIGTARAAESLPAIRALGAEAVLWDEAGPRLAEADSLLVSAGPSDAGDPTLNAWRELIAGRAWRWVGYLSTTGVYGDRGGDWVDEEDELRPSTRRGEFRLAAEAAWKEAAPQTHIFRLAGIYGPGRGPFEKVRKGTARLIIKPGQVFSRIHRDDIAAALAASLARPDPGRIYNLCDDEAAPPQDVIAYAAYLLGAPRPPETPYETADMTPMARSFYAESKRVSNRRLREELRVDLLYPTYREGLRAILADETGA